VSQRNYVSQELLHEYTMASIMLRFLIRSAIFSNITGLITALWLLFYISLPASAGTPYEELEAELKAQNWEEADLSTDAIIGQYGYVPPIRSFKNIPCRVLRDIDALWLRYSNGRFGISVQKRIWVESGAKLNGKYPGDKIWKKFSERVGWRSNDRSDYYYETISKISSSSPRGMLPARYRSNLITGDGLNLLPRAAFCRL
jgi:hypothetical protein